MAIEIVDFPMKNGGSFHSYVTNYQRVYVWIFADIYMMNYDDINADMTYVKAPCENICWALLTSHWISTEMTETDWDHPQAQPLGSHAMAKRLMPFKVLSKKPLELGG